MTEVQDLAPGDVVDLGDAFGVVICTVHPHPEYGDRLVLVVWRLSSGGYSFDALSARQEVGERRAQDADERLGALRWALGKYLSKPPRPARR